jgi:hypothetical protein
MKTTFTIENEKALELELTFHQLLSDDLLEALDSVKEHDFNTRFIFNDLNDEEVSTIENLIENL